MLKLYDTESRIMKEVTSKDKKIKMYTCGPTIYDFAHIGNFRTYVAEDLLRRSLQFFGFQVEQAMNITDLEDKTIRGAVERKIDLHEYTEPFKKAFFEDLKKLSIQKVEYYPEATQYIPEMIAMIEVLLKKGFAYASPNKSIYFSIKKFQKYGRLSHFNLSDLKVNASGENEADEYDKDNIADFVLWKAFDPERDGKVYWESPFGPGRPGWHIECSAMATKLLGPSIDIHCGGVDNLFPHHENEIAQSECCTGKQFVKHWVHVEHLLVDHKKMSKSLGNFYTLRDLLNQGYTGREVRYLLLSSHYKAQLNFTLSSLQAARSSLQRIQDLVLRLKEIKIEAPLNGLLDEAKKEFKEALGNDLNMSLVLGVVFDLVRDLNTLMDANKLGLKEAQEALTLLHQWDEVLAVLPLEETSAPKELQDLLQKREEARKAKNWKLSDEIRDQIHSHGYVIEDTSEGARLKKKA